MDREIEIMQIVQHPNIIKCFDVIDTESHSFIVMEYASGGDLFDYVMENGVLDEVRASAIFTQIINAVEYLH